MTMMIAMNGRMWMRSRGARARGLRSAARRKDDTANLPAERLYATARSAGDRAIIDGDQATSTTLESRFPYGRYAQQAILESAFANWRSGEHAGATAACDRFIRTYPNHANVDYAYYLKGLVYFREDQGLFGYVYELDLSERDPKQMRESFAAFKDLATRFPESRYAEDAQARHALPFQCARHVRSARRAVLLQPRRLHRGDQSRAGCADELPADGCPTSRRSTSSSKSYDKLGMPQLAQDSRVILEKTFPESAFVAVAPPKPWWKIW